MIPALAGPRGRGRLEEREMTIRDFDPRSPNRVTTVLRRISEPVKVATRGDAAIVPGQVRRTTRTANSENEGGSVAPVLGDPEAV